MKRTLKNFNMKPLSHSTYLRLQVLCETFYDADEKLHYLNDLCLDDLKAFVPGLLSQVDIKYLVLIFSIIHFADFFCLQNSNYDGFRSITNVVNTVNDG